MTDQVTSIGIGVDSRPVVDAGAALDRMAASGKASEGVIGRLVATVSEFTTGLRQGANQALEEHRKQIELAAAAAKKLGEELAAASGKIAEGMGAANKSLRTFLAGAVSGAAVMAAVSKEFSSFNRQIDELGKLDDAAQAIGETVEKLSGLEAVAKITNFSFDFVQASVARLTKSLAANDDESKGAAYALKQLGIEARDTEGKLRSGVEITKEVADALGKVESSANKTAYAQAIYGRGAAALIPYLNDLSKANLDVAIATTQQAEAASNYRDAQGALSLETTRLYNVIAGSVLPVFTQVIEYMTKAKGEAGSLNSEIKKLADDGSLKQWAQDAVVDVGWVIDSFRGVVVVAKIAGTAIAGIARDVVTFGEAGVGVTKAILSVGNASGMANGLAEARSALTRLGDGAKYANEDIQELAETFTKGSFVEKAKAAFGPNLSVNLRAFNNELEKSAATLPDFETKTGKAGKAAVDTYGKLIERIAERIAIENSSLEGTEKFTAGQKFALTVLKDLTDTKKKYTDQQKTAVAKMLEELLATERTVKAQDDKKKQLTAIMAINKEAIAIEFKLLEASRAKTQAITDENNKLQEEITTFGLSKTEINNLTIARLEAKLATYDLAAAVGTMSEADRAAAEEIKEQIKALRERNGLFDAKEILEQAKKTRDETAQVWKGIGDDITNYIMSGFKNTRDLLKRMFETLVLRPIISPIANGIAGGLQSSLFGGSGSILGGGGLLGSLFGSLTRDDGVGGIIGGTGLLGMLEKIPGIGSLFSGAGGLLGGLGGAGGFLGSLLGGPIGLVAGIGSIVASLFKNEKGFKFDNSLRNVAAAPANVQVSALGNFAPSGDVDGKILGAIQPFIAKVQSMDKYIADNLLSDDTLAKVREQIQQLQNPRWWNLEDKDAIEKASKFFLQQRYSVAFDEIDKSVADMIRTFSGTADELIQFITKASQSKQVIDALSKAIPSLNLSLSQFLNLTEQQQQDLATIAAIMPILGQDIAQLGADAYLAQTRGIVDSFIAQGDALDDLMDKYAKGEATIAQLADATVAFGQAAVNVIAGLAAARDRVNADVSGGIRSIQTTGLDREALNRFLSSEAETLRAQIAVTTDPAKINDLVQRIIANSTQVFSGLSPEEQAARRAEFISGLQTLQQEANARIDKLNEIVLANTNTTRDAARDAFEAAVDKFNKGASDTLDAANTLNDAADKIDDTFTRGIDIRVTRDTAAIGGLN